MTLIDGDRIITAQLYDDEHEEFTEKKMSIIDYINAYTDEGVTTADVVEQTDGDLISRQEVLDILKDKWNMFSDGNDAMQESIDTIEAITSVKPHPSAENTEEWKIIDAYRLLQSINKYPFCPWCGRRMGVKE